ncbi:MAG TPA: AVAST type 4 anti-phage nuclease Avs4 [Bacteroidales bacterium]|nr:AVAST type 4 anti-phage nuclease Avs4 [Bacteroidales bacterium]
MIDLNWNLFKSKFYGKTQKMFELLAYNLFCIEFDKPYGIFRFKNQIGLEVEPIEFDNNCVGHQAKFYESKINKADILDSIEKAKGKNPNLNRILIYLNLEFSESSKTDKKGSKIKTDIEEKAKQIGVEIDWRVQSHFEVQLAKPEATYLAEFFFSESKTNVDSLKELDAHTRNILDSIHCDIRFGIHKIRIDRSKILEKLESSFKTFKTIIINGNGGTGKTALIKEFLANNRSTPLYIFKASEFHIQNINDLFSPYTINFLDFIKCFEDEDQKIIVIDSAEKISEIENTEPFREFVNTLIENKWCIIFTTRNYYLDDLQFQLIHIYRLSPFCINIESLSDDELFELAQTNGFSIPPDIRLKQLIQTPFYLNEYLAYYSADSQNVQYTEFKTNLWKSKIQNSFFTKNNNHIERENNFLLIVKERIKSGNFFSKGLGCTGSILSQLQKDEIIVYSSNNSGYFITHDIYEEWALDLIIERAYQENKGNINQFFESLGTTLSIRRAFRLWMSDKLFNQTEEVKQITEIIINSTHLSASWNDEIFTSVLLSEYSYTLLNHIKDLLYECNFNLLKKIVSILRIACKAVDESHMILFKQLKEINPEYIFVKPKGSGWGVVMDLIYQDIALFKIEDVHFISPLLKDWNNKNNSGLTTRQASIIAIHFYKLIIAQDAIYEYSSHVKDLVQVICNGAKEVVTEIREIFEEVILNKWKSHNSPYYELCKFTLTNTNENWPIIIALPKEVTKIAELFWLNSQSNNKHNFSGIDIEDYYSLNRNGLDYFPSSALQTPAYILLNYSTKVGIDFIINFTNITTEYYSKSKYGNDTTFVDVFIDNQITKKQIISDSLWSMYRGVGSPVTPNLLQSLHMALEKYLLEIAKDDTKSKLTDWLIYLLKNSKSASISAVVTSVIIAYPDRYFAVALILFKTIPFFIYDIQRLTNEHSTKFIYQMGYGLDYRKRIYSDERIGTLEDSQRKITLENIALKYQVVKNLNDSDEEFDIKRRMLWAIFDEHHKKRLSNTEKLLLARIDCRNMELVFTQKDDNYLIEFNPKIDDELRKFSEDSLKETFDFFKYSELSNWSRCIIENKNNAQDSKYENNPTEVIREIKELIDPSIKKRDYDIPIASFASVALLKKYSNILSSEELVLCRDLIIDFASAPLRDGYGYQISDGVEVAINGLPLLYEHFPDSISLFNIILIFILFDSYTLGDKRICDYSIETIINSLWSISENDSLKIINGFLILKPQLNLFLNGKIANKHPYYNSREDQSAIIQEFEQRSRNQIDELLKIEVEQIRIDTIDIKNLELDDLVTVIQIIPDSTNDISLNNFIKQNLPMLCEKLLKQDRSSEMFKLRMRFYRKICPFILSREIDEVKIYLKPFLENFSVREESKYLLEEFILTEDKICRYDQFWVVWNEFYCSIVSNVKKVSSSSSRNLIFCYLLASQWWSKDISEWHSLTKKNISYIYNLIDDIGDNINVLDAIAQLLNQIGRNYINEGIVWISELLNTYKNLWTEELGVNTVYYLEILIKRYIVLNRNDIRIKAESKERVLLILNFLIDKESVSAYLLREEIL